MPGFDGDTLKRLVLVSGAGPTTEEANLLKLAWSVGVPTDRVATDAEAAGPWQQLAAAADHPCVAMSAETLANAHKARGRGLESLLRRRLLNQSLMINLHDIMLVIAQKQ